MIDAYASQRHYLDHLAPIWKALPVEAQGRFIVPHQLIEYAYGCDIQAEIGVPTSGYSAPPLLAAAPDDCFPYERRVVFAEHGAGQTYSSVEHVSYSGGPGRDAVELFLCPNVAVAARNMLAYPKVFVSVVGSPRVDELRARAEAMGKRRPQDVAVSFHWNCSLVPESRWAYPHYSESLPELSRAARIVGHGHPRVWSWLQRRWDEIGIRSVRDFADLIELAYVYVVDNSSSAFEWAALDRPVVLLNAPWYRREVEHGMRFWEYADMGIQVSEPEALIVAISLAMADPEPYRTRRRQVIEEVYGTLDGKASQRAATAIMDYLESA